MSSQCQPKNQDPVWQRIYSLRTGRWGEQVALTKFCGLPRNTYAAWNAGTLFSYRKHIEKIAEYYGTSIEWLLTGSEKPNIRIISPEEITTLCEAKAAGKIVEYIPGETVYDRFGDAWVVTTSEIHCFDGVLHYLYRCGHPGTNDYRALYSDEILSKEEAERVKKDKTAK